jgi:hypothetical protein
VEGRLRTPPPLFVSVVVLALFGVTLAAGVALAFGSGF